MNKQKIQDENIIVCDFPLVEHNLSVIRNENSSSEIFRNATKRLAYLLLYTAYSNLPMKEVDIKTPICETKSRIIDPEADIIIAPILRAGLAFADVAADILPDATIRHIGMYRDEKTLQPVWYYNKTPVELDNPQNTYVYVLDPMLATGNSSIETINLFLKKGMKEENLTFVNLIASPQGIKNIRDRFKKIRIVTAHIDETLNEKGYIVPGLGDAGDRLFNTFN
ncbi:uracil phosphoribosyltransferase [bacterium]|nr:uracil phosphoribosyltransferase [bacterium]